MLKNLKLLRKEKGVSQQKLADAIRVSQPSINKYENHNIEPDIQILIRMADYFDTSVDFLIGRTEEREANPQSDVCYLSTREREMLGQYRRLSKEQREVLEMLLKSYQKKTTLINAASFPFIYS